MNLIKKKNLKSYLFLLFLFFAILFFYLFLKNFQKEKIIALETISINLLTSVHPNLPWNFKPLKSKINVKPGEVTTIEYSVENLGNNETTGIATFMYFPTIFGDYISKLNCFCYDAQTLGPNQKDKFILILLIDPEVTKDSKTKSIKEATIQFTFFDYREYKENKS
ncbi:cytochrome c oxidase assembly protein [Pelagibacteraceae bacterium]|nr:cytochrome c oxidase assembly protein [Pelagibacteraceae bacterium]